PPAGVSSTLRWRSVAESLMSRDSSAHRPDASALPARLTPSGPGNISGNRVRTVARQIAVIALHRALAGRNQTDLLWLTRKLYAIVSLSTIEAYVKTNSAQRPAGSSRLLAPLRLQSG